MTLRVFKLHTRVTLFFGPGEVKSFEKIAEFIVNNRLNPTLVITGKRSYKVSGAWDVVHNILENKEIEYGHYDKVTANPTVDIVQEAAEFGKEIGAKSVIGIGGGSVIDCAKAVAVLLTNPKIDARELYRRKKFRKDAAPVFAINTTHGTGTEVDHFAVATIPEDNAKVSIAHESIYPRFSIDDPELTLNLPKDQTIYVTIDALSHALESMTTKLTSPFTVLLAKEASHKIFSHLPAVINDLKNIEHRYWLLYASMLAGITLDNSRAHLAHALEHPISAIKPEVPHGLGLAILLPKVISLAYKVYSSELAEALKPIAPNLKGRADEADIVEQSLRKWIGSLGIPTLLGEIGISKDDVKNLSEIAFRTMEYLLKMLPLEVTKEEVEKIYLDLI